MLMINVTGDSRIFMTLMAEPTRSEHRMLLFFPRPYVLLLIHDVNAQSIPNG
jgi:hypothetical protein